MTGDREPAGWDDPLTEADFLLLDEIRRLTEADDPVPDELVPIIRFAMEMQNLDEEVSWLSAASPAPADVRGGEVEDEVGTRTITFEGDGDSLTIMVRISGGADARGVRIDGWLAPPAAHRVELRTPAGELATVADEQGRFVLDDVPHGLAQLVVRPLCAPSDAESGPGLTVTTPAIVL
jgi:hypothetical protein